MDISGYISGGSNVHPREIEEKMLKHPVISEAAVLAVADWTWGAIGGVVVLLRLEDDSVRPHIAHTPTAPPDRKAAVAGRLRFSQTVHLRFRKGKRSLGSR